jgi:hypothetical protein
MKTYNNIAHKLNLNLTGIVTISIITNELIRLNRPDLVRYALENPDKVVLISPKETIVDDRVKLRKVKVSPMARGILPPDAQVIEFLR